MATPARDDRVRLMPALTLRDLATTLMQGAETETALSPRRRALLCRDGLMIFILRASSPRARNVAELSIGTSLQRRGDEWWVTFGPVETKNGRPPISRSSTSPSIAYRAWSPEKRGSVPRPTLPFQPQRVPKNRHRKRRSAGHPHARPRNLRVQVTVRRKPAILACA